MRPQVVIIAVNRLLQCADVEIDKAAANVLSDLLDVRLNVSTLIDSDGVLIGITLMRADLGAVQ